MEIIIFQLLSCLYLYDSSIPMPVRNRKQIRYTGFWRWRWYTVPPVYRLLASRELTHWLMKQDSKKKCLFTHWLIKQVGRNERLLTHWLINEGRKANLWTRWLSSSSTGGRQPSKRLTAKWKCNKTSLNQSILIENIPKMPFKQKLQTIPYHHLLPGLDAALRQPSGRSRAEWSSPLPRHDP